MCTYTYTFSHVYSRDLVMGLSFDLRLLAIVSLLSFPIRGVQPQGESTVTLEWTVRLALTWGVLLVCVVGGPSCIQSVWRFSAADQVSMHSYTYTPSTDNVCRCCRCYICGLSIILPCSSGFWQTLSLVDLPMKDIVAFPKNLQVANLPMCFSYCSLIVYINFRALEISYYILVM